MAQAQCLEIYFNFFLVRGVHTIGAVFFFVFHWFWYGRTGSGAWIPGLGFYIFKNKIYHRQWSWMKFPKEPTQANKYPSLESTGNFLR